MRTLLRVAVAVGALALAGVTGAFAQARAGDAKIAGGGVRLGYDGVVPPERWSPLAVTIRPGENPQSLLLTVVYDQDPTQKAAIRTPVTTTPGVPVTVPLLICPPQGVDRIEVTLTEGARILSRAAYARSPLDGEINLTQSLESGAVVIGSLGQRVPAAVIEKWNAPRTGYGNTGLDRAAIVQLRPEDLGETWACFDGLNAIVARQSALDRLPTPTLDALSTWVLGGGRLVLILDTPGDTWRRFVPPGVHAGDLRPVTPPASIAQWLRNSAPAQGQLNARPVTLDADAKARGWTSRLAVGDGGRDGALLADGVFGGGITVLAAFDPSLISATLSDAAVMPLWEDLVITALPERKLGSEPAQPEYYNYMVSSGDGTAGSTALRSAVDALCDVPPVPPMVYVLIVALSAALGITVSLVDYIVLGRLRSRQRSWLVATAWIGACAVIAWALPNIVRGGASTLGRAVVVDVLPGAGQRPAAWRSGVTALFAATSSSAPIQHAPPSKEELGGYWRGVSVLEVYDYGMRQSHSGGSNLPLEQHVSALDGASAAVVPPPQGIPFRQWTLRTLQDFGPTRAAPSARVAPGGTQGAFVVTGLPASASVRSAAVQTADGWAPLNAEAGVNAAGSLTLLTGPQPSKHLSGWHTEPVKRPENQPYYNPYAAAASQRADGHSYLQLDGARRRTPAFDALVTPGGYAVVHLMVDAPPDVTTSIPHSARGVRVYRIAVPLTESTPPSPSAATP